MTLTERDIGSLGTIPHVLGWGSREWALLKAARARNPNAGFSQGVLGFLTELGLVGTDAGRHLVAGYDPGYGFAAVRATGEVTLPAANDTVIARVEPAPVVEAATTPWAAIGAIGLGLLGLTAWAAWRDK